MCFGTCASGQWVEAFKENACTHTGVATRSMTVTSDAYELLAARKRPGESFSEVITRILGQRSLKDLIGALEPALVDELEARVMAGRDEVDARMAGSSAALGGGEADEAA